MAAPDRAGRSAGTAPLFLSLKIVGKTPRVVSGDNRGENAQFSPLFPLLFYNRESACKPLEGQRKFWEQIQHNSGKKISAGVTG